MEQNEQKQQFRCTGDCLNCRALNDRKIQWQYCASQHAYNTMRMIQNMQETISVMSGTIDELKTKVTAIQDSEALVFAPDKEENSANPNLPIAQSGSGA